MVDTEKKVRTTIRLYELSKILNEDRVNTQSAFAYLSGGGDLLRQLCMQRQYGVGSNPVESEFIRDSIRHTSEIMNQNSVHVRDTISALPFRDHMECIQHYVMSPSKHRIIGGSTQSRVSSNKALIEEIIGEASTFLDEKCPQCKRKTIRLSSEQRASSDEGATYTKQCMTCGYKTRLWS